MSVGRNTIYNVIGSAVPLATGLLSLPLYIHRIGPERYGVLAIAWALLGYFGLFDLGLGTATAFRISAQRDAPSQARADTFWSALTVNCAIGALGAVVLWAVGTLFFEHWLKVRESLRGEIVAAVPLLAMSVPVATITGVLTGALQARERFFETNLTSGISSVLFQVLPLAIAYAIAPNLELLIGAALISRIVAIAVLWLQCQRWLIQGNLIRFQRSEVFVLMRFGGWVTVASFVSPIIALIDRFAIGSMLGARAVTIYAVPMQITKQVSILPSAITSALFPRLSASSTPAQRELAGSATRTIAGLLSLPIVGAIFVIGPFLSLYVGPDLAVPGAPLGRILLLGMWANALALVPYTTLQASGRPDLVSKVLVAETPVYLVMLFGAMHYFGLIGVAIAATVRNIFNLTLLSCVERNARTTAGAILLNFVPVFAGVLLAGHWSIGQWQWWAAALSLGAASTACGWHTMPPFLRPRLVSIVRAGVARLALPAS
jgi:O-antigen/teichoic acid export membrane protein